MTVVGKEFRVLLSLAPADATPSCCEGAHTALDLCEASPDVVAGAADSQNTKTEEDRLAVTSGLMPFG
jgi:hypothetical protein